VWIHFAWALTEGGTLWRTFSAPCPVRVLLIRLELSEEMMHRRLQRLAEILDWTPEGQSRFTVRSERSVTLNRERGKKALIEAIGETPGGPPDVAILDSFNAAMRGEADKTADAREALHALHEVQEQKGITWGLTGELRKPTRLRDRCRTGGRGSHRSEGGPRRQLSRRSSS
jgi:AAA domain